MSHRSVNITLEQCIGPHPFHRSTVRDGVSQTITHYSVFKPVDPYQVHKGDIYKYSSCYCKYPSIGLLAVRPNGHAHKEPKDSRERRDKVEDKGHIPGHPGGQQDEEVAHFVRDFVEDDGNGGADPERQTLGDGSTEGKAVSKVVDTVSDEDHPGKGFDVEQVSPHFLEIVLEKEGGRGRESATLNERTTANSWQPHRPHRPHPLTTPTSLQSSLLHSLPDGCRIDVPCSVEPFPPSSPSGFSPPASPLAFMAANWRDKNFVKEK